MRHSFFKKGIFCILLFYFSALKSQKVTVVNNTSEPFSVKSGKEETKIYDSNKKEFSDTDRITINSINNLNRFILLFLEPTEKLTITIEKNNKITYTGDQAILHEYINEKLNIETFGKMNIYEQIGEKKNVGELKNTSELFLVEILRKIKSPSIIVSPEDKSSIKKLKNYVKYNWLYTIFSTLDRRDKTFKKEALNYYFKKYIETDISQYTCNSSLKYSVITTLAKNKPLLQTNLPAYPIIEHTDDDIVNQYLPQSCQRQYFQEKYNYLEHINGHNKEYYKKVLIEKFNVE